LNILIVVAKTTYKVKGDLVILPPIHCMPTQEQKNCNVTFSPIFDQVTTITSVALVGGDTGMIAKWSVATVQMSSKKGKFTPTNLPVLVWGLKHSKKTDSYQYV
jgi:hypothetical protein